MKRIVKREDLAELINDWRLHVGVEVGVYEGAFSAMLLRRCPLLFLYCVDPWDGSGMTTAYDGDRVMAQARDALAAAGPGRFDLMRTSSVEAAARFEDGSLDFAYIDAVHTYDAVRADLNAWCCKVRSGGVMAGHDYKNLGTRKQVRRAVDEMFGNVYATQERCPSWWVRIS